MHLIQAKPQPLMHSLAQVIFLEPTNNCIVMNQILAHMGPDDRVIIEYFAQQIFVDAMFRNNTIPKQLLKGVIGRYKDCHILVGIFE